MLKIETRRRLIRLHHAIEKAVISDSLEGDILPALFSVFTLFWCSNKKDLTKE